MPEPMSPAEPDAVHDSVPAAAPAVLAVRLDSMGDVLLTGPALRALRAGARRVDLLVSPGGAEAANLLPAVDHVLVYDAPWCGSNPPPLTAPTLLALIERLRANRYDQAVIFTSYHQSPLPMALVARLAGIPRISATSDDYPGSLLDVRHRRRHDGGDDDGVGGPHEVQAALALAAAAGFESLPGDDGRLQVRGDRTPAFPDGREVGGDRAPYVVLHPGSSAPSRGIGPTLGAACADALVAAGWHVVVTGGPDEIELARDVTPQGSRCLAGSLSLAQLAGVIAGAAAVVVGNTGPAHLAAAVGTPVVCLFTPVVPVARWGPWGVRHIVLGDQDAPCAGSRVRDCSRDPQPCLAGVRPGQVAAAVNLLAGRPGRAVHDDPSSVAVDHLQWTPDVREELACPPAHRTRAVVPS